MRFLALPLSLLLASSQVLAAPAANPKSLAEAKSTASRIERLAKGRPARTFVDTNTDPYEQGERWREVKPPKKSAAQTKGQQLYNSAQVWMRGGKVALAEVESSSFAGDWMRTTRYAFRTDGSLAKLDSTLSTFYSTEASPLIVRRVQLYDAAGRILSASTLRRDGKTGRALSTAKYLRNEAPLYLRVSKLPFYKLLQPAR